MVSPFEVQLQNLNHFFSSRQRQRPTTAQIRQRLLNGVGSIHKVVPVHGAQLAAVAAGRPLVGVDGSVNSYGVNFPQVLHLFRAMGCPTDRGLEQGVVKVELFYPEVDAPGDMGGEFGGEHFKQEAANIVKTKLAALEVAAAFEAVSRYNPFLVLFDGGFLRYGELAPDLWQEYREFSLRKGVISVGVIEEVGTFDLARSLFPQLAPGVGFTHDRDLLFGALEQGEWLKLNDQYQRKKGYHTCFARPSQHPQVVAYDFFVQQKEEVQGIIPTLFGLTPPRGRGIPWWLDQVDATTRITQRETDLLLDTYLERHWRERVFTPNRERRSL